MIEKSLLKLYNDQILSLSYTLFINGAHCGYLEVTRLEEKTEWKRFYVVLSNVGLLYFNDGDEKPVDLLPMQECLHSEVDPSEVEGSTTVFMLSFPDHSRMFRTQTLA